MQEKVDLSYGSGGKQTSELIQSFFMKNMEMKF